MAMPPRKWVGYAFLVAGLLLLFDTYTFLRTNESPLRVPLFASDELALGYLLAIFGVAVLLAPAFLNAVSCFAPDSSVKIGERFEHDSVERRLRRRLPLKRRRSMLPDRAALAAPIMLLLMVPLYVQIMEPEPTGIAVRLGSWRHRGLVENWLPPSIVVRVNRNKDAIQITVNGKKVRREDLEQALKTPLGTRPDWEVYVAGDDSMSYSEVMDVIDVIHSLGAMPVMLTPRLEKEMAGERRRRR